MISVRHGLSRDQEVGLVGELVALIGAIGHFGSDLALSAWRGPMREEHDFGFPGWDVEVKTTTSESRRHVIGSVTQLLPTPGRKLYVLSIQLTTAGAQPAWSLPSAVERARSKAAAAHERLNIALTAASFHDDDGALYTSRWTLRSAPRFYLVDANFPALTPERLAATVPAYELVDDVRYRINLTDVSPAPELFTLPLISSAETPL